MQQLVIDVVRRRGFASGDGFHVYGNGGSGAVDWEHPVTSRRYLLHPDTPPAATHLRAEHLHTMHLDTVTADGHLQGTHLLDACQWPAGVISHVSRPLVFGRFSHAVVVEDAAGNADTAGAVFHEQVINAAPPPPSEFKAVEHDASTGRLTFSFTPSDRLAG